MVKPTGRGGAAGPGDGAIAPYAGFAKDAVSSASLFILHTPMCCSRDSTRD
jgi:hypothetical protein